MAVFIDGNGGVCACARRECSDECLSYRQFKPKPQTHYDRLRAKSVEEMAEWFIKIQDDVADYYDGGHAFKPEFPTTKGSWLDWLKQEAEE